MLTIPRMRTPVVVAPHGHALAGGCGIVAAADVAIAAEGTVLATSEITIGLFPIIVYPTLVKAIGARAAREMALDRPAASTPTRRCGSVSSTGSCPPTSTSTVAGRPPRELAAFGAHALGLGKWFMARGRRVPAGASDGVRPVGSRSFMTTPGLRRRPGRVRREASAALPWLIARRRGD